MFKSRTPQFRNSQKQIIDGSIATLETVRLGEVDQTIMIRGMDVSQPILLFLHGGPGWAQIGFARHFQAELEKHFIVVNWDQRGSGKSRSKEISASSMTVEQMVKDTKELIEYLLKRFGKKKLFLAGHSWGSVIGSLVASKYPELLHAYIAIGQFTDVERAHSITYRHLLIYTVQARKRRAQKELEEIGYPPYKDWKRLSVHMKWLMRFGGFIRSGGFFRRFLKGLVSPEYTLMDWLKYLKGMHFSRDCLCPEVWDFNIFHQVPELKVPAYFCVGRYDFLSQHELQQQYVERLNAPHKELVWFEKSAHCPHFEEPAAFLIVCLRAKEASIIPKRQSLLQLKA
ncbi:alpha/beta fold hydrolase [Staphylospora marina]|uniref:alpha/beta fold hydrolase n=1 Tax=Staphylospora marina TaxID=2490858 RepID=UPI000F5C1BCA|nr:alpha/beta hydrolase [Staphylospora marina]